MMIQDSDLGEIQLLANAKARRITVRFRDGKYILTHHPSLPKDVIIESIEKMKPQLFRLREKAPGKMLLLPGTPFRTYSFNIEIEENSLNNYYSRLKDGVLYITYPKGVDCSSLEVQTVFREKVEKAMRYEANRLLPLKVRGYAEQFGFTVENVKINKSVTRWGSCSGKKVINLSYFNMLLPEHLIDFVILHELCHTKEMNHGEGFWKLLDMVSGGRSKELTKELGKYHTRW